MLFRRLAETWASALAQAAGEEDAYRRDLARYVFETFLSGALSLVFIVAASLLFRVFRTALLITATIAVLKSIAGGLHMSTPLRCAVTGAFTVVVLSCLALWFPWSRYSAFFRLVFLIAINVIVWRKAPLETKRKPLTPSHKYNLAVLSRVLVFSASFFCLLFPKVRGMNELFYSLLFQGINLLEVTAIGVGKLDHIMGYVEKNPVF
ncbi:MAG TPA: accessory gene regulator B family protein [Bacillota bacterium]